MPSSCREIRDALAACLQASPCVLLDRNKPSTCLHDPALYADLPIRCKQLAKGYGECKRGMVDMRKRFRGNMPLAVSRELEGGAGRKESGGGQLYGGRPAIGDGGRVGETAGYDDEGGEDEEG